MSARGGAVALGALVLAALSLLLWPFPPAYDAWVWLGWGRDIAHLHLDTDAASLGVAWKPLPALIAAPLSAFGDAAPDLWALVVRFSALLSLLFAYRVGERLSGRVAGVAAALALALIPGWWEDVARADAEPLLCAAVLAAIDLHLRGRRGAAIAALSLAALVRPEVWVFLAGYAILAARSDSRLRLPAALAGGIVGLLWFGSDLVGSGDALTGAGVARQVEMSTSAGEALGHAAGSVTLPAWALVAFVLVEARGGRTAEQRAIGAIALLWLAEIVLLGGLGYLGSQRFVIGPAALLSVLAGLGVAAVLSLVQLRWRPLAALVLLALALPLAIERFDALRAQTRELPGPGEGSLAGAIEAAGGRRAVLACPGPIFTDTKRLAELAYRLDGDPSRLGLPPVPLDQVLQPGIAFVGPRSDLLPPGRDNRARPGRFALVVGSDGWSIYAYECRGLTVAGP